MYYDVVVIGGGPSGMAAALAAKKSGANVLILERDVKLGGILNQCIHNGFGLHYFGEELTGPEYADRFVRLVENSGIKVLTEAMALSVSPDRKIVAVCPKEGLIEIEAGAIALAMGCRERSAGAIMLAGSRPSGVYTAGMAQRLINIDGFMVGKRVVILGSGDIGLIMARRMTYEGAKVDMVLELMPYSAGLKRNIAQCLNDYNIPLLFRHTVTRLVGKTKLEGIYYAEATESGQIKPETEKFAECDCLLLSVGLIPENDLVAETGIEFSGVTSGAVVDENRQTTISGIFAAGNVLHVHDLVDNVSCEAEIAGEAAAKYAKGEKLTADRQFKVVADGGVRYALPQRINAGEGKAGIFFRVASVIKNAKLTVLSGDKILLTKKYMIVSPGEMETITVDKADITDDLVLRIE